MKRMIIFLCLLLALSTVFVSADDGKTKEFINGKQDYLVLGSIHDINDTNVTLTVDHVLNSSDLSLVGSDILISRFEYSYCQEHTPENFNNPIISDNVIISLEQKNNKYHIKNGAYKVDSNEYASCKVIVHEDVQDEDCLAELLKVTCYIRSNAKVKEFNLDEEGRIYAVYPQTREQCLKTVDDKGTSVVSEESADTLPTVPPAAPDNILDLGNDNRWIIAVLTLIFGIALGISVGYFSIKKKN